MSKGKNVQVNKAEDYEFVDPTGKYSGAMNKFTDMANYGMQGMENFMDPNMAYNNFMNRAPGMVDFAFGATSPLTEQLNTLAETQASRGIANAGTQFAGQGALHSGAAARAMGEAAANPFAQVAADQSKMSLGLAGNLLGQDLANAQNFQNMGANLYGNIYNTGMSNYGQMAQGMGGMMAPQYQYKKGFGDYLGGAANMAIGGAMGLGALGWKPFG